MSEKTGGIYIHIPYCRKKCLYCDFFSGGSSVADWSLLRKAVLNELTERFNEVPEKITSIYFGGGTPSMMPLTEFRLLFDGIIDRVGKKLLPNPEITLEINPEDVMKETAEEWKNIGINRASLGIESFDDKLLGLSGRLHSGAQAQKALETLGFSFDNVSADLIFGLPGQTLEGWTADVRSLISLSPSHISAYSLMFEPGTAFTALQENGRLDPVDDEVSNAMFVRLTEILEEAGYDRYETSNYSRPGFQSRHNNLYWHGAPYLGLGPSAHSYDGFRTRRANPRDLFGYLRRFGTGGSEPEEEKPFYEEESLSDEELREEFLLTRLRLKEGFELEVFRQRFGEREENRLLKRLRRLPNPELVRFDGQRVALSREGVMTGDSVIVELAM